MSAQNDILGELTLYRDKRSNEYELDTQKALLFTLLCPIPNAFFIKRY
jgi:hypothetical protein